MRTTVEYGGCSCFVPHIKKGNDTDQTKDKATNSKNILPHGKLLQALMLNNFSHFLALAGFPHIDNASLPLNIFIFDRRI